MARKEQNQKAESAEAREMRLARELADYHDQRAGAETAAADALGQKPANAEVRSGIEALDEIERMLEPPQATRRAVKREALPERLSGHKILSEIGAGGMGRVLLAVDERLGRKVAIKTLNARFRENAELRTRFMQEARAMARISHPNIVHIYNLGGEDEQPHFVMEYLDGVPLTEAAKALTLRQKVELMHKVVEAVEVLHQRQILHRDLKPGNILAGPDLEPKLLDFGLALQVDDLDQRVTAAGEVLGTPNYFSPEQARAEELDVRSDVFALGTVFYELLTGALPFRGETFGEQVQRICEQDPVLPRRLNPDVPGDLQNICLKAMEKKPAERYATAREMADDLERYLAGEPVLAAPSSYSRLMAGKISQHVRELEGWRQDRILSDYEFDGLRKGYGRLVEKEDAWIMEVRRLSLPQVSLYLGAWVLVVGAALIFLFRYLGLSGALPVLVVTAAAAPTVAVGIRTWKEGRKRIAIAYLLAFCLLLPVGLLVAMGEYGILAKPANEKWEFFYDLGKPFKPITNAQIWWAMFLSLPTYLWLRRFTKSSVFSLVFAVMGMLLWMLTLARMGLREFAPDDPGWFYYRLIPLALAYFAAGTMMERRQHVADSRYFYPIAVAASIAAMSGLAGQHEPYANWLGRTAPWTHGQVEYLFILNAGIYYTLHGISERFHTPQMRTVAKTFRFVVPGHVLTSLLLLGLEATKHWDAEPANAAFRTEARVLEFLLPLAACLFVFWSIPKQMKNYLASGLLFLAIGIVRLQQDFFKDRAEWPIVLLLAGTVLMFSAARYPAIKLVVRRWLRQR